MSPSDEIGVLMSITFLHSSKCCQGIDYVAIWLHGFEHVDIHAEGRNPIILTN